MFFKILILFGLFTVAKSDVKSFKLSSCGNSSDLMQNIKLDISPKLPQIDYMLYLSGDLYSEVTQGTSQYDITLNFIPLSPSVNDLCTEIANSNVTCPLKVDHFESESKGNIPTGVKGLITIKNQWFNQDNQRILCMKFDISL
jgi:hypothetical protein